MTDLRARHPTSVDHGDHPRDAPRGAARFQPAARRRNRIALGVALGAIAVGANVVVYASLDDAEPVVQVVRDVPAGSEITADMLRTVDVDADPTVNVVAGDRVDTLVGAYAKVRLVAGSLVTTDQVQADPLVSNGAAIVAVQIAEGSLPAGLRERVPVLVVIPARDGAAPASIEGRVVGLPVATSSALGVESLSLEVDRDDAVRIAAADDIRIVLLPPSPDPATDQADGP